MVNWIEMVVLDPNNKRGHVFEAWIRLIQNECEIYIYIAYVNIYDICKVLVFFFVLIRVALQAANCAWPWLNINSKKDAYQGTSSPGAF